MLGTRLESMDALDLLAAMAAVGVVAEKLAGILAAVEAEALVVVVVFRVCCADECLARHRSMIVMVFLVLQTAIVKIPAACNSCSGIENEAQRIELVALAHTGAAVPE